MSELWNDLAREFGEDATQEAFTVLLEGNNASGLTNGFTVDNLRPLAILARRKELNILHKEVQLYEWAH